MLFDVCSQGLEYIVEGVDPFDVFSVPYRCSQYWARINIFSATNFSLNSLMMRLP